MSKKTILIALAGLVALLVLSAGILNAAGMLNTAGNDTDELMVEVTITNLTRGQTMTSVFVAPARPECRASLHTRAACQRRVGGHGGGW